MSVWSGQGMQFLDIHFLDVGHGDCTIVEFPERLTVIDINNCKTFGKESETELRDKYKSQAASSRTPSVFDGIFGVGQFANPYAPVPSPMKPFGHFLAEIAEAERKLNAAKDKLTNPIDYLKARFPGRPIFRYIQSHPDMDHMAGLHRIWIEEQIPIINLWDTKHCIEKDEVAMRTGQVNHDIKDWHAYKRLRTGSSNVNVVHLTHGQTGEFWTQDGIAIWAPFDHSWCDNPDANPNDLSYLLRIQLGKCDIVLGGDATVATWETLYKRYKTLPKICLLKASHHGRKSGYHMESVKAMNPDITITSVGELKAKDDASASYERFSKKDYYSTLDHGDIIARCWLDGEIWFYDRDGTKLGSSW